MGEVWFASAWDGVIELWLAKVSTDVHAARANCARRRRLCGHRIRCGAIAAILAGALCLARAAGAPSTLQLLEKADSLRLVSYPEFTVILKRVEGRSADLPPSERDYLHYLEGWKSAYDGNYPAAVSELEAVAAQTSDATLRFRARVTVVNVFVVAAHYEEAFVQLEVLLKALPGISDGEAREQALVVAGELYNPVGQYDLALYYGRLLAQDNYRGLGVCKGSTIELEALFKSGKLRAGDPALQAAVDTCTRLGLIANATAIRTYAAKLYIGAKEPRHALALLSDTYPVALATRYPRLISEYEALLAQSYLAIGDARQARAFAQKAVADSVRKQFTEPLVTGDRILYQLAKAKGNFRAALEYHERYAAANLGYLNDVSVRQLAYEKVRHHGLARRMEIQSLNRKNRLLELERRLGAKEVEATRLYGVILTLILLFIGLWAVRTKRSQLHFMNLSHLDGLTGISNRLHFIERAESALAYARKSGHEVCLVLFDLDHFKSTNDHFGHATGDFVLERTAAVCRSLLRVSDIFGRLGGEEFGVLLPGCRLEAAGQQAEHLREAINGIEAEHRGAAVRTSASFGIASSAASGYDMTRLLAHADSALYRAKRAGRNCVMAYDSAESAEVKAIVPPAQA